MICYKDRAFCSSDCVNYKCGRCRTPNDYKRAKELGLSFSLMNLRCHKYLKPKEITDDTTIT